MFSCGKCGEPLYIKSADLRDKILSMEVQCLNGHRGIRRMVEEQAKHFAEDVFSRLFVCLECGSVMTQIDTQMKANYVQIMAVCPIHGIQKREIPSPYLASVSLLGGRIDPSQSIVDSFKCPTCSQVFAITEIDERDHILEIRTRCANGHKETRFVPQTLNTEMMKKILQRVLHCEKCLLPSKIARIEERGESLRVHISCPVHGETRKDVSISLADLLKEAADEIPEDAVIKAMLTSSECRIPLAIRKIEETRNGYKFKCVCPANGHSTDRFLSVIWNEPVRDRIARAVFTCDDCGLQTHLHQKRKKRNRIEFKTICPIHGVMKREAPIDVFSMLKEDEPKIDRLPSIIRSMSCTKCDAPLILRDVEDRRGLVELEMECRSNHRTVRFFPPRMDHENLVTVYKNLFACPECYGSLDLVYTKNMDHETRVVLLCPIHGKYVLDIPPPHAEAMEAAYEELQADRLRPPEEVEEIIEDIDFQPQSTGTECSISGVRVYRGCEIIGGKFDYKVKIQNDSGYVITNVTVGIVAFPEDCMEIAGGTVKTISRIEVGGFRSPQFSFYPTKDCVQGKVVATVSYIDFRDQLHTIQVEPFLIRSVCDLLKPSKKSSKEFDLLLDCLTKTNHEQTLDWNARVLFTKAEKILPAKNFHIVDSEERLAGGQFIGSIRGFAVGKYTSKKVAVIFLIMGPETGRHSLVKVEALGEDVAMLPTTIDELAETMDSWVCLRCGAALDVEQVEEMGKRSPIRCRYCSHSLTIGLYLK